jgi:DNA helicase-2/ATP-dependent DNA helicase PcrA
MKIKKLTDEQKEILEVNDNMLVTASPGSGKTKTIVDLIEKLAVCNEQNKLIVAITYTYRAADEIAERLDNYNMDKKNVWTGTIHKFCNEFILSKYNRYIPHYKSGYEIIDEDDLKNICLTFASEMGIRLNYYTTPNFTLNTDGTYAEENKDLHSLIKKCYSYMYENKLLSFDLILYESFKLLCNQSFIKNNIAHGIEWLIVDEYQDTKELQYDILSFIAQVNLKMKCVFVGDPNQAIYKSLGGVVKSKDELDKMFLRNFNHLQLTGCFRSHQAIIDFYSNFALINEDIISRTLMYNSPLIKYQKDVTIEALAEIAYKEINTAILMQNLPYEEICIMLPTNPQLLFLSNIFRRNYPEIPIDAPMITPLKRMEDSLWNNLGRLIFTDINGKNIRRIERILRNIYLELSSRVEMKVNLNESIDEVLNYLVKLKLQDGDEGIKALIDNMRYILGCILLVPAQIYEKPLLDLAQATELKIQRYRNDLQNTVNCFKSCYKEKSGVVISTCHGCKGEEYRVVIAGGLNESYIPHSSRQTIREDAYHLLYVVFSRAKEKLIITSFPTSYKRRFCPPTKELDECKYAYD